MTEPLNIIVDIFSIWLLGYRIKFNCLYIPQGHYFINTMKYRMNLSESPPLNLYSINLAA